MLTQDDFMAPSTAGEQNLLRRSSWKANAIRRGDLKISGPIPITDDMPVNEVEETVSAEKVQQVEGSPPKDVDAPIIQTQDWNKHELAPLSVPPNLAKDDVATSSHDVAPIEVPPRKNDDLHQPLSQPRQPQQPQTQPQAQPQPQQPPQQPQQNRLLPPGQGEKNDMHRRSATEPSASMAPSPYPSINDGSTKGTPKKRKSGLRNVFRKMFGRRSRGESLEREGESQSQSRGHSQHISDPGLLRASSERQPARRGQRISELPVQEPKPLNPLGQHLPFPMNVNAPQEVSPPHEYLTFEIPSPELGRRRATLPGILPDPDTHSLDGRMKQRLETWDERNDESSIPSPQIGIALSSPPGSTIQSKRRSRSAGALRDLAREQPSMERRRSSEIRHWRNSYASGGSFYSKDRPQTAQTVDTVMSTATTKEMDEHLKILEPPVETETTPVEPGTSRTAVPQHDQDLSQIRLPVEAFNFGNLKSGFSDDEDSEQPPTGEQSRARSTSPVHEVEQKDKPRRLSIEDRVKNLEHNMRTLETSVHRLSGRNNRQTIILENAPKSRRGSSRNRSSSGTSERQGSHHSSTRSRSSSQALPLREHDEHRTSSSPTPLHDSTAKPRNNTVISEDTQRPATASHYHTLLTHLTSLQNALTHERHSRKVLESHVINLQRELSDLHALVNRLLRNTSRAENYPTPSPDTLPTGSVTSGGGRHDEEKMTTPRASRGFSAGEDSGIAGMSGANEENHGGRGNAVSGTALGREAYDGSGYSSSREDLITHVRNGRSGSGGSKSGKDTGDAMTSPEVWATPKEESGFMFTGRGEAEMF